MAETLNASGLSGAAVVVPIYSSMLQRAEDLALSGATLEAADMLTTAAETMRRFEHPAATQVADWARELLGDSHPATKQSSSSPFVALKHPSSLKSTGNGMV